MVEIPLGTQYIFLSVPDWYQFLGVLAELAQKWFRYSISAARSLTLSQPAEPALWNRYTSRIALEPLSTYYLWLGSIRKLYI